MQTQIFTLFCFSLFNSYYPLNSWLNISQKRRANGPGDLKPVLTVRSQVLLVPRLPSHPPMLQDGWERVNSLALSSSDFLCTYLSPTAGYLPCYSHESQVISSQTPSARAQSSWWDSKEIIPCAVERQGNCQALSVQTGSRLSWCSVSTHGWLRMRGISKGQSPEVGCVLTVHSTL